MIIRKTKAEYNLSRYGGTVGGAQATVRVGSVPLGTNPDAIPDKLLMDLTPNELKVLKEKLQEDQNESIKAKAVKLIGDMADISSGMEADMLDREVIEKLGKAALKMSRMTQRVLAKKSDTKADSDPS